MYTTRCLQRAARARSLGLRTYATLPPPEFREPPPLYPKSHLVLQKPHSPSFYTGRQGFHDTLYKLEDVLGHLKYTMRKLQLLPIPIYAKSALPLPQPAWKSQEALSAMVGSKLTTSRHRKLLA